MPVQYLTSATTHHSLDKISVCRLALRVLDNLFSSVRDRADIGIILISKAEFRVSQDLIDGFLCADRFDGYELTAEVWSLICRICVNTH